MKKISKPLFTSTWNSVTKSTLLRSLSLPKGRSELTESIAAFLVAILLTACGESTTTEKIVEVATGGVEVVDSVKDLPKCTKAQLIAVAFEAQKLEEIAVDSYDVLMKTIVTEKKVY